MSRVHTNGTAKAHVLTPQTSFNSAIPKDGHDERGSLSGSDDGSYAPYPDVLKNDVDNEEENNSLISQTLNTDGTPKRPMNAFMIFARRRRPQVSAENQAMRTGEVSKILSKEWSAMPAVEKQFYQDQARQLKEWFNSKYPDYVYRRRPNHSRRPRRKPDMPTENVSVHDAGDDTGFDDSAESPHDGDDSHGSDTMADIHRPGTSAEARPYGDQGKSHTSSSRTSSYTYPMFDAPYRTNGRHDNQLPYPSTNGDRYSNSPSSSHLTPPLQYSLVSQSRAQSHSTPLYGNGSVDHENWNLSSSHGRPSSWLGNGSERSFPPLVGDSKLHEPLGNWHRQPVSSSGNLAAGSSPESSYVLPTLNSPFFPDQAQHASHSPLSSYSPSDVSTTLPGLGDRHYDDHTLSISSTNGTGSYHSTSGRHPLFYPTRAPTQTLPSISSYAHSHSSSGLSSLKGYW